MGKGLGFAGKAGSGTRIASHRENLEPEETAMRRLRQTLQHLLNPPHLFCRRRDLGLAATRARRWCGAYERVLYRLFL
jgi:hypothetical protein